MLIVLFLLGLCVGSFLNVLISRLPKNESVIQGRSHCDYCKRTLQWYELIPLLSFVVQKGKSRCCKKPLSIQYPLVELLTGIGFVLLFRLQSSAISPHFFNFYSIILLTSYFVLLSSLIVIFISDLKYEIIPMPMIITGIIGALIYLFITTNNERLTMNYFVPAILAFFFFWLLWFFTKGKAMGDGDMYLVLLVGLLTGFPKIVVSLYAAFLTGALSAVILMIGGKKGLKSHIAFGPFLIIGLVIALLFGDAIIIWWRSLW